MFVNPIIGYDNLLNDPTVTSIVADPAGNPAAAGFDIPNAHDWLDWDFWRATNAGVDSGFALTLSAPKTADYFAVAAHDLATQGATIVLQYWNLGAWADLFTPIAPTTNGVIFKTFASKNSNQWRVLVSGAPTAAVSIGVVSFGDRLAIPAPIGLGFTPPNMAHADQVLNNVADGGALLGRSIIGKGIDLGRVSFDLLDPAWMRANWIPFMDHANLYPFFFQWEDTNYNSESAFVWTKKGIDNPSYNQPLFMTAAIDLAGRRD